MRKIKVGDLVRMRDTYYSSEMIGIAMDIHPKAISTTPAQIAIHWFDVDRIEWEPEAWVEVVSAAG